MNFEQFLSAKKVKMFLMSVIIGVCITSTLQCYSRKVMADISSNVVRFHVIANSDSKEDQELKLKVRDGIINYLEPILADVSDVEETKRIIEENIEAIEEEAEKILKKNGYTYSVTASLGNFDFPTKEYENAQFPKGKYDALRIVIGEGKGQNWWCVLYPQLCFSKSTDGTLSPESETKLKNVLNEDEYDIVTSKNNLNFKFKIVEWFSF